MLRMLVVEVAGGQATVWGWAEGPGCLGVDAPRLLVPCEEALTKAEAMARGRADGWFEVDQMLVGLPASQLQGRAWSASVPRAQPEQPVKEWELEALLGRTLRLAVDQLRRLGATRTASTSPSDAEYKDKYAAVDPEGSGWLLVDATIVALTVDGRKVTDPVGFRAKEIGATVFAALTSTQTVEVWRQIAQELDFSMLTLAAAPLALAQGLNESQGVLLDVGGDTTDLTLWQGGRPVALDSVPLGGAAMTQTMMHAWELPFDTAERLKRAYVGGYLTDEDRVQILQVMFPALRAWLEETEMAMARLGQEEPLPHRLYLFGGGSALPEIVEAARALAWSERLHFKRYPQVGRLRPTDVPGVVNRTDLGQGTGDVSALALAAWFALQARQLERPARILNELCGDHYSG